MGRFTDARLEEVYYYRTTDAVPRQVCIAAHRIVRLLAAARSWSTITLFAEPKPIDGDRFAIVAHSRWHVSFAWSDGEGASEMRMEKL